MAQILLEQRYGRAVDWWAFGVLTYEMLLGQSPFRGDDEDEIFDAILEDEPLYPITMPRDAVSILQKVEHSHALLSMVADISAVVDAGPYPSSGIREG
jgi:serine/threonine protein kinase